MVKPSYGDIGRAIDAARAQHPGIDVNGLHNVLIRRGLPWTLVTPDDIREVLARRNRAAVRRNSPRFPSTASEMRNARPFPGDPAGRNTRFDSPGLPSLCPGCGVRPSVLGGCKCSNWRHA
jgi:hypothetical protein